MIQFYNWLICKIWGHNWKQDWTYSCGGIAYRCTDCGKDYVSWCGSPNYKLSNDKYLWDTWRAE
jgi:hypothetical protein